MFIRTWVLVSLIICAAAFMPARTAMAADVDELLRLEDWLHGPPAPPEPLYAYA